jgi:hypothetical protein
MDVTFRGEKRFVWAQFNGTWNLDELPPLSWTPSARNARRASASCS